MEEILVSSDVGVETTLKIIDRIQARVKRDKYVSTSELNSMLREEIADLMKDPRPIDPAKMQSPTTATFGPSSGKLPIT